MEVERSIMKVVIESPDAGFFERAKNYSNEFFGPSFLRSNDSSIDSILSPAQFGCLTALLIIAFSKRTDLFIKEKYLNRLWFFLSCSKLREYTVTTLCFIGFLALMPMLIVIFTGFWIYRHVDELRLKNDKALKFKGLLNGEDIVWACDDTLSKSIINILAYVRAPSTNPHDSLPENLLNSIRDRIHTKLILTNQFPKMFYQRRKSESGYFYWTNDNALTVEDYVRFAPSSSAKNEDEFKREMSELASAPLPADNSALWECLIGENAIQVGDVFKCPVIFRVHHAVGDGIALLRLLLEALNDDDGLFVTGDDPILPRRETFSERTTRFAINLMTFYRTPHAILRLSLNHIDDNQIHPEGLSGNKKVNWLYESDSDGCHPTLLTTVKLLKRQFDGARFSSILLAALSKSIKDFFERKNYAIPKDMTIVIPARLSNAFEDPTLKLENRFSVALHTLPIDEKSADDRVKKITKNTDCVNSSPDYLLNFWLMSYVFAVIPECVIKVIMKSKHCTLAISNLPGPNFAIKINGHEFENVGFFLPNVGLTACGITILSYNNKLHFGIMTDDNAIDSGEELGEILEGMVREIKAMTLQ